MAPATVARASAPALNVAASSFAPALQTALPAGDLLPPSMSPPTNERLTRVVDDAFRTVWQGTKFPTGQERTDLMNMAIDLRNQGQNAPDIQLALTSKVRLAQEGLDKTDDPTLNRLVKESFQYVYEDPNHLPNGTESQKYLKVAQDLAAGGMSATDIKFELRRQIRLVKDGLDKTDDPTLNRLVKESFQYVYEDPNHL
ncbi:MAG: hypothetical protein ACJ8AT_25550, partial [Hyalangium sp.]|uniref:hypothetical protein n=1 Tax=Hyalangium sp. TaxID=2028555 RepID=UPI00389AF2A1